MVTKKRAVSRAKVRVYKKTIVVNRKPAKIDIFMPEPWSRVEKCKKVKVKNEYLY